MANPSIERRGAEEKLHLANNSYHLRFRSDAKLGWAYVPDDAQMTGGDAITVSLSRFQEALTRNDITHLGVRILPGEDVRLLQPYLARISLVELAFPTFRDGRNYSSARILREQLSYTGEIRAIGQVLADQLFFMVRCGIDALDLDPSVTHAAADAALSRFKYVYQAAGDARRPVWDARLSS